MPDIELRHVLKRFGTQIAVNGIDLAAEHGEMLTLLGPSGCGKTTTLRMIAGLEDLTKAPSGPARRSSSMAQRHQYPAGIAAWAPVFQSYAIWPHMTR
jgi:ABC-type Fe3+/spermidine/putrescine transport system ATPase subunit